MTAIERPSDEVVMEVVRQQHNASAIQDFETEDGRPSVVKWWNPRTGMVYLDPRDDPNAALELLHEIVDRDDEGSPTPIFATTEGWRVWVDGSRHCIPISGPPFRYAVINLAAKVMETL